MCELMALSFEQPVSADFSLNAFALRDAENADGWGLAWYPDQSLAIVKEALEWRKSPFSQFLQSYRGLISRTYIAHVRHQTTGRAVTHADTHPFGREWAGRDYCLAHNGTLQNFGEFPLGRFRPIGATDSEHFFCYLLDELASRGGLLDHQESWRWLHAKLSHANQFGKLNCLLSDGDRIFCYRDTGGWKGLHARKVRFADQSVRHFGDPNVDLEMASPGANRGFVVATAPLSDTGWHSLAPGELLVLERGTLMFSSSSPPEAVS